MVYHVTASDETDSVAPPYMPGPAMRFARFFAWAIVAVLGVFLINVYLTFWQRWPGAAAAFGPDSNVWAWAQAGLYGLALLTAAFFVLHSPGRNPREDNRTMTAIAAFVARFAFWAVVLLGLADATISFLRVEDMLAHWVGESLAGDLGRNQFRGPNVHLPLLGLALLMAAVTRTIGFHWLAMLVVIAELQIVICRFVFSYEQAFMGDLVRFWYAGLFLFSSAYTLVEDGHVRVDVLYSGMSTRKKGLVNAIGAIVLGLPLCWVILAIGFGQASSIITSPLLALEISQQGFGMFIKYLMAAMLGIFAVTMTVQFAGYFLNGLADYAGAPATNHHRSTDPAQTGTA